MTPNITDEQRKQIEQEAEKYSAKYGIRTYGAYDTALDLEQCYIAAATPLALSCQQKDEEIARLRKKIQEIDNMAQGNVPVSFWKIHLVCEDALEPIIP